MNQISCLVALCVFQLLSIRIVAQDPGDQAESIIIGEILSIYSEVLDEKREIYVALPRGYDTLSKKLPVIYVLDAEYRFELAKSIHSYFGITTRTPRAILIGVANPSQDTRVMNLLPNSYGGFADKFSTFISTELFPLVEDRFKANQDRTIIGHSHGGVFTLYTLLNNPDSFSRYIAIDPSLKHIYQEGDSGLDQNLEDKRLYLASSDVAYGYLEDVAADMQADFAVFKNKLIQSRDKHKLQFKIDHINDDHGNSYINGLSRGLRYVFNWRFE